MISFNSRQRQTKSIDIDLPSQRPCYRRSTPVSNLPRMKKRQTQDEAVRMGFRIRDRLAELGWGQVDLLERIPDLDKGTLSAIITNNRIASVWSDEIADALGVEHRWLQTGRGEKMKRDRWPFKRVSREDIEDLPDDERTMIEGYIEGKIEEHRKAGGKRVA